MPTIFVTGSKGGVGKSLVSCLVLHSYLADNQMPFLIESDDSNPDVYKTYGKKLNDTNAEENTLFSTMDTERGWRNIFKKICEIREKTPDRPIVVNTGARIIGAIEKYGALFDGVGDIITLWVIDDGRESMNLLDTFLSICHQKIVVIKNGFFSDEKYFYYFNNSYFSKEGNTISNVFLNKSTIGIISALQERIPFDEMDSKLDIVDRVLAADWLSKSTKTIKNAIEIAAVYERKSNL